MSALAEALAQAAESAGVPGAACGWLDRGERTLACHGVEDLETGHKVGSETIFRLGSITKVLTALAVVRLAEAGGVALDQPAYQFWPALRALPLAGRECTLAHLLSHSSGLFGDLLQDRGDWTSCLPGLAAAAQEFEFSFPPGAGSSYANAGIALAAGVMEQVAGALYPDLIDETLLAPLNLSRTGVRWSFPDARIAASHVADSSGGMRPLRGEQPLPVMAPAGSTAWTSLEDITSLAAALLRGFGGMAQPGLPSPAGLLDMLQERTIGPANGWGLGFGAYGAGAFGHDGAVAGQASFLRFWPQARRGLVLLTNGGDGRACFAGLIEAMRKWAGEPLLGPARTWPDAPLPLAACTLWLGRYGVRWYTVDVEHDGEELVATLRARGHTWDLAGPLRARLRRDPGDPTGLVWARFDGQQLPTPHQFHLDRAGAAQMTFRGRRFPRTPPT